MVENDLIDIACHDNDALILPTEVTALTRRWQWPWSFQTDGRTLYWSPPITKPAWLQSTRGRDLVRLRRALRVGSALFAEGPGQDLFDVDLIDNTDIAMLIAQALGLLNLRGDAQQLSGDTRHRRRKVESERRQGQRALTAPAGVPGRSIPG